MLDQNHLSKLAPDGVERVLVDLFFALSRVNFIGVNYLLGQPTKRVNECSLLFSENLGKMCELPKY